MISISSESEMNLYLEEFNKKKGKDYLEEIDLWTKKMEGSNYTHYDLLTFMKIMDNISPDDSDSLNQINFFSYQIEELSKLMDYLLDRYNDSPKYIEFIDKINNSLNECKSFYKYYNEKIIN